MRRKSLLPAVPASLTPSSRRLAEGLKVLRRRPTSEDGAEATLKRKLATETPAKPKRPRKRPDPDDPAVKAKMEAEKIVARLKGKPIQANDNEYAHARQPCPDRVSVGSDCSGLGTDCVALKLAGVRVTPAFASDLDPSVRTLYKTLHGKSSNVSDDACSGTVIRPSVDLYVAGPPCQSWSAQGKRAGLEDLKGRGVVFYHCLEYVRLKKPRAVVFENVLGLRTQHVREFSDILTILSGCGYAVTWEVMNSRESGLPQSRARVYIVAIHRTSCKGTFRFPTKLKVLAKIDKFLDHAPAPLKFKPTGQTAAENLQAGCRKLKKLSINYKEQTCLIDLWASPKFTQVRVAECPCITATRAKQGGYYITNQKRMTRLHELGRLQGWPTDYIDKLIGSKVPKPMIAHALGNGMSVNVVYRLLPRVLRAAGLIGKDPIDKWKHFDGKAARKAKRLPDELYQH